VLETVDLRDVRVVQRGESAGFVLEAGESLAIGDERRRQDLDRDLAPELAVTGAVHLAPGAGAERSENAVGTDVGIWLHGTGFWPEAAAILRDGNDPIAAGDFELNESEAVTIPWSDPRH
jgi:hypothetical protein